MVSFGQALRSRVTLGSPRRHERITVYPLLARYQKPAGYLLFDEALERNLAEVQEVSEAGSVPWLRVKNRADVPILLLEGQEVQGGKQNRVINVSALAAARSELVIPVSCVERGRWHHRSSSFSSGHFSSPTLRRVVRRSVSRSATLGGGYSSDQGAVWASVDSTLSLTDTLSPTSAVSDSYLRVAEEVERLIEAFPLEANQLGLLVCLDGRPLGLDLFPDERAYQRHHRKVLHSYVYAALYETPTVRLGDVPSFLGVLDTLEPTRMQSVGLGTDCRLDTAEISATALEVDGAYLYASAIAAA